MNKAENSFHYKLKLMLDYFLNFLEFQCFVSLFSSIILICWGLEISLLSPLGNLIFSPFLTLFMILSAIIFFAEIVGFPNYIFIVCLKYLVLIWRFLMQKASKVFMLAMVKPPIYVLAIIFFAALFVLFYKPLNSKVKRILALAIIFAFMVFCKTFYEPKFLSKFFTQLKFTAIKMKDRKILIDNGLLASKLSTDKISYNVIPELNKNFGDSSIDFLVIKKVGPRTIKNLPVFLNKIPAKILYVRKSLDRLSENEKDAIEELCRAHNVNAKFAPVEKTNNSFRLRDIK